MNKDAAIDWLWAIAALDVALGALIWLINTAAIQNYDYYDDSASVLTNATVWQSFGAGVLEFGVLVAVIALATSAVVGAIEGQELMSSEIGPSSNENNESNEAASVKKSLKTWLDEDKK